MEADSWACLASRAAFEGRIDFTQADSNSAIWRQRESLLLREMQRAGLAEWYAHRHIRSAMGTANVLPVKDGLDRFNANLTAAGDAEDAMWNLRFPFIKRKEQAKPQNTAEAAASRYKEIFHKQS